MSESLSGTLSAIGNKSPFIFPQLFVWFNILKWGIILILVIILILYAFNKNKE